MRYGLGLVAAVVLALAAGPSGAQTVTSQATTSYSIIITITSAIASVNLSNTSLATADANNANAVVGAVTCTTNPAGGTCTAPVTLGGADAGKFKLTNNGQVPCNLTVGAANVPAGTYAISLSATQ